MLPPSKPDQLHMALEAALKQIRELISEPFSKMPTLSVIEHNDFWALAELREEEFHIRVSTGVVTAIAGLWVDALMNETLCKDDGEQITKDIDHLTHVSLVWLLLHEMEHLSLGHFAFMGKMCLTETAQAREFSLVSRANTKPAFSTSINQNLIEPCLELQADHDAVEMLLDAYSPEHWDELRVRAACISAVMVLIEKEDHSNGIVHSSHPKASARIFQLLGHISEMWSHPARAIALRDGKEIDPSDLPSEGEKQAFVREIIRPAFWDAVALAEVADAKSIISDLGSPEDFFADIANAKLGRWDELITVGAKEWAELKDANDLILPLLPNNQTTT